MNNMSNDKIPANLLWEIIAHAYRSNVNIIAEGPTGIGKSDIVFQVKSIFEAEMGGEFHIVRLNCATLEPTDLLGLPQIIDGKTRYAIPAFLPTSGNGILQIHQKVYQCRLNRQYRMKNAWQF